nr:hypothetical protein Iba_chr13cCG6050 [Ipomoea batatas]
MPAALPSNLPGVRTAVGSRRASVFHFLSGKHRTNTPMVKALFPGWFRVWCCVRNHRPHIPPVCFHCLNPLIIYYNFFSTTNDVGSMNNAIKISLSIYNAVVMQKTAT